MKTITLPAGTEYVRFEELAHLMAIAMWPPRYDKSPGDGLNYGYALVTIERELALAAQANTIPLKDPLTKGPYIDHPGGTRLEDALIRVDDLRKYVDSLAEMLSGLGSLIGADESGSLQQREELPHLLFNLSYQLVEISGLAVIADDAGHLAMQALKGAKSSV